jgi:hypothetical protein
VFYANDDPYFGRTFRDTSITIGQTYTYQIATVDTYGQRSPSSTPPFTAFVDPALNIAPAAVVITCWPNPIPTNGPAWVRVNARETNVQNIAFTLGVDVGTLTSTPDPSRWIIEI